MVSPALRRRALPATIKTFNRGNPSWEPCLKLKMKIITGFGSHLKGGIEKKQPGGGNWDGQQKKKKKQDRNSPKKKRRKRQKTGFGV